MTRHKFFPPSLMIGWLFLSGISAFAQSSTSALPPSRIWVDVGFGSMSQQTESAPGISNAWIMQKTREISVSWARNILVVSGRFAHVESKAMYLYNEPYFVGEDVSLQVGLLFSTGRSLLRVAGGIGLSNRRITENVFGGGMQTNFLRNSTAKHAIFPFDAEACWTPYQYAGLGIGVSAVLGKERTQFGTHVFLRLGFLE